MIDRYRHYVKLKKLKNEHPEAENSKNNNNNNENDKDQQEKDPILERPEEENSLTRSKRNSAGINANIGKSSNNIYKN